MKRCSHCLTAFDSSSWVCPSCGQEPVILDGIPHFAPDLADSDEGFPQAYFAELAELEAAHFWFRVRNRIILDALACYRQKPGRILEVGCGTAFVLEHVNRHRPDLEVCGSEIATKALTFASNRLKGAKLYQMDARTIPFSDEFDVIGMFDVLEHIAEDTAVLTETHRALKPGGLLFLTVPQHPSLWSHMDEMSHHARRYTWRELRTKLKEAGFLALRHTSFMATLMPLMWLSRNVGAASSDRASGMEEMRINRFVNKILEFVLEGERQAIRLGATLPFGGSLFVVAQRL